MLMTQEQQTALETGFPGLGWAAVNYLSDPPTAEELRIKALIMEGWLILFYDDPDNMPNGEPKDTWNLMLGATHDEMIAAGINAVWP